MKGKQTLNFQIMKIYAKVIIIEWIIQKHCKPINLCISYKNKEIKINRNIWNIWSRRKKKWCIRSRWNIRGRKLKQRIGRRGWRSCFFKNRWRGKWRRRSIWGKRNNIKIGLKYIKNKNLYIKENNNSTLRKFSFHNCMTAKINYLKSKWRGAQ